MQAALLPNGRFSKSAANLVASVKLGTGVSVLLMDIPIILMTQVDSATHARPSEQRHPCLQELRVAVRLCKMRLRIKTFDGRLERISVEDNSTLGDLQKHVAGVFPNFRPDEVKLSLNKKVSARLECIETDV